MMKVILETFWHTKFDIYVFLLQWTVFNYKNVNSDDVLLSLTILCLLISSSQIYLGHKKIFILKITWQVIYLFFLSQIIVFVLVDNIICLMVFMFYLLNIINSDNVWISSTDALLHNYDNISCVLTWCFM